MDIVDETLKESTQFLNAAGMRSTTLRGVGWFTVLGDPSILGDLHLHDPYYDPRASILAAAFRFLSLDNDGNWDGNPVSVKATSAYVKHKSTTPLSSAELIELREILSARPVDVDSLDNWFHRLFARPVSWTA